MDELSTMDLSTLPPSTASFLEELKAAEAEITGTKAPDTPPADPSGQTPAEPAATPDPAVAGAENQPQFYADGSDPSAGQPAPVQPPPGFVPVGALVEVRRHAQDLNQQVAFLAGQLEAFKRTGAQPDPVEDQPPAPQVHPLDEIKAAAKELARRFDAGEITAVEWQEGRDQLDERREQIKAVLSAPDPVQAETEFKNDPLHQSFLQRIEHQNPWIAAVPVPVLQSLADPAKAVMAQRGRPYRPADMKSDLEFRATMVEVARHYRLDQAFGNLVAPQQPAGAPAPTAPIRLPNAPPQVSPAQVANKLALAGAQPPAPSLAGTPGTATNQSFESMSVRDMAALPDADLQRLFLGG